MALLWILYYVSFNAELADVDDSVKLWRKKLGLKSEKCRDITLAQGLHCSYSRTSYLWNVWALELRQYKNDSIQSKIIPTLKLPLFLPLRQWGKKRANFKIGIIFDLMESF